MPVRRVEVDGQPAYRWGDRGRAYTFDPERPGSEERAKANAEEQGRVIEQRIAAAMTRTFKPPAEVRDAAQAALVLRASLPPSRRAMTAVGLARARDLANGRSVSMETILRLTKRARVGASTRRAGKLGSGGAAMPGKLGSRRSWRNTSKLERRGGAR